MTGAQGSGKTYMGEKLKLYYGDTIHVKDMDNLYSEFLDQDLTNYQGFIDQYIAKHRDRPLVFVGLDADLCLGPRSKKPDNEPNHYNLHAKHRFYINDGDETILRQRFFRQIKKLSERKEQFFSQWLEDPGRLQDKLIIT